MSGLDILGAVTAILGALEQVSTVVRDLKDRFEKVKSNRERCEKLANRLLEIKDELQLLKDSPEDLPEVLQDFPQKVQKKFEDAEKELKGFQRRVLRASSKMARLKAFGKSKEWAEQLDSLVALYDALYGDVMHLVGIKGLTDEIRQEREKDSEPKRDAFNASFLVPKDLKKLVLQLGDTEKPEGMLLAKVLDSQGGDVAAAAWGMGGVGKTVALVGISQSESVQEHFTGGTYWMSLGENVTDADVVEQVAKMVENSGGLEESEKVRGAGGVDEAGEKAARWFSGRRCLFMCDDLWSTESTGDGYFCTLKSLADERSGSRIVCSTRDREIAKLAGRMVHFRPRTSDDAKHILCKYAEFNIAEMGGWDESIKEAFQFVLNRCGGLPLTLSIAGRAVEYLATTACPRANAWLSYKEQLEDVIDRYEELITSKTSRHRGLFSALIASLRTAGQRVGRVINECKLSAQEMYEGLCVLEKQQWAPTTMLTKLWRLEDERKAGRIVQVFGKLSLADVETRTIGSRQVVGLKLHDLAHDYCVMQATKNNRAKDWHAGVLEGYALVTREVGEEGGGAREVRQWWSKSISNDEYIHKSLGRHLVMSESIEELEGLLLDFRWTERQLEVNGLLVLENDFQLFTDRIWRAGPTDRASEVASALRLIIGAVRLSWPLIERDRLNWNRRDLAFQIHGRLCDFATKMKFVKRYLQSVETNVKKPWAKAEWGCLEAPGGPLRNTFNMDVCFWSMAVAWRKEYAVVTQMYGMSPRLVNIKTGEFIQDLQGHDRFVRSVAISGDEELIVSGSEDRTIRIWDVRTGKYVGEPLHGHSDYVSSVVISEDGERIVSGSYDCSLKIWDVRTRKCVGKPLRGHKDAIACVAISKDGERIVSGSMDCTLRIWDVKTGNGVGEPLRGHKKPVCSVAISEDGASIVSGSADCSLRIWDMKTGNRIGDALVGHSGAVVSVAVSANGEFIVSGSADHTIRTWSMKTQKGIGEPLQGHHDWVRSVAISEGGERVISGSLDGTLRIWDVNPGKCTEKPPQRHHGEVTSVVTSGDGLRLVSGSDDCTVRIWDRKTGRCSGGPLRGHEGAVLSVAISEDGKWIASGSFDETLRMWEVSSGKCIGEPLRGHSSAVMSVAIGRDGQRIVSGSHDHTVRIWDAKTGKCVGEPLQGHSDTVGSVAISEDGRRMTSGSYDKTLRIWDMKTGKAVGEPLRGHRMEVGSVAISGNGDYIVSTSRDLTCRVWDIRTQSCLQVFEKMHNFHRNAADFLTLIGDKNIMDGTLGANAPEATFLAPHKNRIYLSDNVLIDIWVSGMILGTLEGEVTAWTFVQDQKLLYAGLDNGRVVAIRVVDEQ